MFAADPPDGAGLHLDRVCAGELPQARFVVCGDRDAVGGVECSRDGAEPAQHGGQVALGVLVEKDIADPQFRVERSGETAGEDECGRPRGDGGAHAAAGVDFADSGYEAFDIGRERRFGEGSRFLRHGETDKDESGGRGIGLHLTPARRSFQI